MEEKMMEKWEVLGREYLYRRPWLTVRRDRVRLPTGAVNDEYYVLEYPTWVNVIPNAISRYVHLSQTMDVVC